MDAESNQQAYVDEVLRWRAARQAALVRADGWLSLVGLAWLHPGLNSVGSDPACDVVLPPGVVPIHAGDLDVAGGAVTLIAEPASGLTHEGKPVGILPMADEASGSPTVVMAGSVSFFIIRREEDLAVRIRDSESPARFAFRGIDHYPIDPAWRVTARFDPNPPGTTLVVPTVLGTVETYRVPGVLSFAVDGVDLRLEAWQQGDDRDLFLVFGDLTNRDETYPGGRYHYARPPDETGTVVVDFNKAYNPPCVFTSFATCALAPPQNRLPVRIAAGEKRYDPG